MKIKTIWHYAFAFFETSNDLESFYLGIDGESYYKGEIKDLTYKQASAIAQIHPSCLDYYGFSMMPLFQGKGKLKSGTEDPVMAGTIIYKPKIKLTAF